MKSWELASLAAIVIGYAALSRWLARTVLTSAIVFVTLGFLLGDHLIGAVELTETSETIKLLAEVTLALVLFLDASRIDLTLLRREYAVPVRLLVIGLPLTIVAGALLALPLLGALTMLEVIVLAVVLAPTDAALGQAVVSDRRVPSRIRQGLNVESGLNDGICVPLLLIALAVAETDAQTTRSVRGAFQVVLEQIGYGMLGGALAALVGALALNQALRRGLIEPGWLPVIPAATAALAYGLASPLGGSGFIAAFVAGLVFGGLRDRSTGEVSSFVDQLGNLFAVVTFIMFGAVILWPTLEALTWEIALYAVLSLTVVRMLPVVIAMFGTNARPPTLAFLGWFGPRGLATIVFALIVLDDSALPGESIIVTTAFATVALSVFAHGLTSLLLTNRYVGWYERHPRAPSMESVPVGEHPARFPLVRPAASEPPARD